MSIVGQRLYLTHRERAAVWEKTGGCCAYCGKQTNPFRDFTIDHVVPLVDGGSDTLDNLTCACSSCNLSKGPRPVEDTRIADWPEERYQAYRAKMARSVAIRTLVTELYYRGRRSYGYRDVWSALEHLGIEAFRLRPGGEWRVWRDDREAIEEHVQAQKAA